MPEFNQRKRNVKNGIPCTLPPCRWKQSYSNTQWTDSFDHFESFFRFKVRFCVCLLTGNGFRRKNCKQGYLDGILSDKTNTNENEWHKIPWKFVCSVCLEFFQWLTTLRLFWEEFLSDITDIHHKFCSIIDNDAYPDHLKWKILRIFWFPESFSDFCDSTVFGKDFYVSTLFT